MIDTFETQILRPLAPLSNHPQKNSGTIYFRPTKPAISSSAERKNIFSKDNIFRVEKNPSWINCRCLATSYLTFVKTARNSSRKSRGTHDDSYKSTFEGDDCKCFFQRKSKRPNLREFENLNTLVAKRRLRAISRIHVQFCTVLDRYGNARLQFACILGILRQGRLLNDPPK